MKRVYLPLCKVADTPFYIQGTIVLTDLQNGRYTFSYPGGAGQNKCIILHIKNANTVNPSVNLPRWTNIETTLGKCTVFAGNALGTFSFHDNHG